VPIIIGEDTAENLSILTEALTNVLQGRKALLIASSDLSHYPKYEDAIKVDTRTLSTIETMDDGAVAAAMAAQMAQNVPGLVTCACGHGPITVALRVSEALGADHARILRYANSGDVGGNPDRVVGYASVMFWQWEPPELTNEQKVELLGIARQVLEEHLSTGITPAIDPPESATLHRRLGAFVTLTLDGELRGCVGNAQGDKPLFEAVAGAAVDAANNDSRFLPLNFDELNRAEIEISVLSPFKRVPDVHEEGEIEVGLHGLSVLSDGHRGLLLPQVPVTEGWGRAEFLEQVCSKAGLPGDCWEWAAMYTFTAEVFGEVRDFH
jgi:AmmeMemoRadiSam system protein A